MTEPQSILAVALAALAATAILARSALIGWRGWLDLQRHLVEVRRAESAPPSAASRIEIADLRERVRKLEAIAAGVDL